jgi:argininosuccinate synthase
MDEEGGYDQRDAAGFIRINAVRLRNNTNVARKAGKAKKEAA